MARIEKTVFISYRRKDIAWALAVYQYLTGQKYDVFFDYTHIPSGDFEQIIIGNIKARAHFILILTPTTLDRCSEPGDWVRREIETAMEEKRNIVPLFFDGFSFGLPNVAESLTGKLVDVKRYNGLDIPSGYFPEAMERLSSRYLNVPLSAILHPVSTEVKKVVKEEKSAADKALREQKSEIKELVKPVQEKPEKPKQSQAKKNTGLQFQNGNGHKGDKKSRNSRFYKIGAAILFFLLIGIAGVSLLINANNNKQIRDVVVQEVAKIDVELDDITIDNQGDNLHLTLAVIASHQLSYEEVARLQQNIASRLQRIVSIDIKYTLEARLDPVIPSAFTNTPAPTTTLTYTSVPVTLTATVPPFTPTPELVIGSNMTGKDGMTLLYVPAGEFTMGSEAGNDDEKPVHTVYLDAFWIDQTEVTNAMFVRFLDQQGNQTVGGVTWLDLEDFLVHIHLDGSVWKVDLGYEDHPVVKVTWYGAHAYCSWVNRRLPTEAEWEKAARGEKAFTYPWGEQKPNNNLLNYNGTLGGTTEVGRYPAGASPYGVLDMAGNVLEWVNDWYYTSYYAISPAANPHGPSSSDWRVLRGSSWISSYNIVRSSDRKLAEPSSSNSDKGFRCAMDAE